MDKFLRDPVHSQAIISTIEDLKITERLDHVLYNFCIYFLNPKNENYQLIKSIKNVFLSIFKYHEKIRIDILSLILSSLSDNKISLSSDILDMISNDPVACESLSVHSGLLEEAFINSSGYLDRHIKSIALGFCNSAQFNKKIVESIMIFIRKTLFSGQVNLTKIGIILVQISLEKDILEIEDISRVMEWVYQLFESSIVSTNNEYIIELFDTNIHLFNSEDSKKIYELMGSLIENLNLIVELKKPFYGTLKESFSFEKLPIHTTPIFLSKLIQCYTKYSQIVQNSPKIIYDFLSYGFEMKELSSIKEKEKGKINYAYSIITTLLSLCDIQHQLKEFDVKQMIVQSLSKAFMFEKGLKTPSLPKSHLDLVSFSLIYFTSRLDIKIYIDGDLFTQKMIQFIWKEMRDSYQKDHYPNNLNFLIQRGTFEYLYQLLKKLVGSKQQECAFYILEILGCSFYYFHEKGQMEQLRKIIKDDPKTFYDCFYEIFETCNDLSLAVLIVTFMYSYLKPETKYQYIIGNLYAEILKKNFDFDNSPFKVDLSPLFLPFMDLKDFGVIMNEISFLSKLILAPLRFYSYEKSICFLMDILYCLHEYTDDKNIDDEFHKKYKIINSNDITSLLRALLSVFTLNIRRSKLKYHNRKWDLEIHLEMFIWLILICWKLNYIIVRMFKKFQMVVGHLHKHFNEYLSKENNLRIFQNIQKVISYMDSFCEKSKLKFQTEKIKKEKTLRQYMTKFWTKLSHFQVTFLENVKINSIDIQVEKEDVEDFYPFEEVDKIENEKILDEREDNVVSFFDFIGGDNKDEIPETDNEEDEDESIIIEKEEKEDKKVKKKEDKKVNEKKKKKKD